MTTGPMKSPTAQQFSISLNDAFPGGLSLLVDAGRGTSPESNPHAAPGRLVRASSADAELQAMSPKSAERDSHSSARASGSRQCERPINTGVAMERREQASSTASSSTADSAELSEERGAREMGGSGSDGGGTSGIGRRGSVPTGGSVKGDSIGGGGERRGCSRSSSPVRGTRIWRASAGWWPDGPQPPPSPVRVQGFGL